MSASIELGIASSAMSAVIDAMGSQLVSVIDCRGRQLLWDAGPQWPWHAPLLFPTIGRVVGDEIEHEGRRYRMPRHGFGRDQQFELVAKTPTSIHLRLHSTPHTHQHFPFDFVLDVEHSVVGGSVRARYTVTNTGQVVLPVSLGVHPAFVWGHGDRSAWRIEFADHEDGQAYRLHEVLLADRVPNPVRGRILELDEDLFGAGAIVLTNCRSASLRLVGPDTTISMSWNGFEHIAVWSPLEPALLCVEPWSGIPSPNDFRGDVTDKPGQTLLPSGTSRTWGYTISAE